jgi:peptide chain release factor 2
MQEGFWQDVEKAAATNQEISRYKKQTEPWIQLRNEVSESCELMEMAFNESDYQLLDEIIQKIEPFQSRFDMLENLELLSGDDDSKNAFISIHPGAGGTESQDWASMLFRMYLRWAEKHEFGTDIIDYTPGEEAGIKSATVLIQGELVYGLLKGERGIHRLCASLRSTRTSAGTLRLRPSISSPKSQRTSTLRSTSLNSGSTPVARQAQEGSMSIKPTPR